MKNLKKLRENAGFTIEALADTASVSPKTIYYYEKGLRSPLTIPDTLSNIANALNISICALFSQEEIEAFGKKFFVGQP